MFLQPPEFYLLRTPVNSLVSLSEFTELTPDELLKKLSSDPAFMEGIFIASPELYQSYAKYLNGESSPKDSTEKLFNAVYKYYTRYCSKSTPFGAFAGYTYGTFTDKESIRLKKRTTHVRHTRLDMNYIVALCDYLGSLPEIREQVKYYINNTYYVVDNKLFYIEFSVDNFTKTYRLSAVDHSEYIEEIISVCRKGASLNQMITLLEADGIPREAALDFVLALIENKILLTELEPTVLGLNNLDKIISIISPFENIGQIRETLGTIADILKSEKSTMIKSREIMDLLSTLIPVKDEKNLLQLDLEMRTSSNEIGHKTVDQFLPDLESVFLAFSTPYINNRLEDFKRRYIERYEGNEMPLSHVLDPVYGIGYDVDSGADEIGHSIHIKDLPEALPEDIYYQTDRLSGLRLKKLTEALTSGSPTAVISKTELLELKQEIPYERLPDSYYVLGALHPDKRTGNCKLSLQHFIGSSGMNLMNRFLPLSPSARKSIKKYIRTEESFAPDKIYAEIVHLPQPRVGNILLRPNTRNFEIPYLAASNLPPERQILFNDLMVSVKGGKIILRSRTHKREVKPMLTSAHMYMTGINVYKFLGDLQKQGLYDYNLWNWKELSEQDFLPRIEAGNIIVCPARWKLHGEMAVPGMSLADFKKKLDTITPALPALLLLVENEQELLIDTSNKHSLNILYSQLLKYPSLDLQECLQEPENALVKSDEGGHFHEVLIPFHKILQPESVKTAGIPKRSTVKETTGNLAQNIPASYMLGSEWLFFKIYCGIDTADSLLNLLRPYLDKWLTFGIIDRWFYIRYQDPDYHLRIRLHGCIPDFYAFVIRDINVLIDPLMRSGKAASLVTANYVREIARYGILNINSFEEISYWDSNAALKVLQLLKKDPQEDIRWLLILKNIDVLLNDFGFDLHEKLNYVKRYKNGLFAEINADNSLNKILNGQFRQQQQRICAFLNTDENSQDDWRALIRILKKRSVKIRKHLKTILLNEKQSKYQHLKEIQFGIVHLSVNRLCKSEPRKHELVFYHHLEVFYTMQINKLKPRQTDATARRNKEPVQ
jgi:thiopeptide-type bacteriocin biosynthesis protein